MKAVETPMVPLRQIGDFEKCRTQSGRYLYHRANLIFQDELGRSVYPESYGELAAPLADWPYLTEGEIFRLVHRPSTAPIHTLFNHPQEPLFFETEVGFRFRVLRENYKMKIPFRFQSTDERVKMGDEAWTASSGRIPRLLLGHPLQIRFDGLTPKLYVGFGHHLVIPKQ